MNQSSKYAIEIYHVALAIRESLEYGIHKQKFDKNIYLRNKDMMLKTTAEKTPFITLLDSNGERGQQIKNNISDFIDLLYSEDARVVRIENDEVIVDPAFSTQVFDYVVGLHETIFDILNDFVKHTQKDGTAEPIIEALVNKDNLYYRSIVSLVLTDEIHRLFLEFNKTMREAQGKENPQSSFVLGELNKIIGFYNFVQQHSKITDEKYLSAVENTKHVLEVMSGKAQPKEGKDLRKEIVELNAEWKMCVQISGMDWSETFNKAINELRAENKETKAN